MASTSDDVGAFVGGSGMVSDLGGEFLKNRERRELGGPRPGAEEESCEERGLLGCVSDDNR